MLTCARRWLHREDLAFGEPLQKGQPVVSREPEELAHRPGARRDEHVFRAVCDAEVATTAPLNTAEKGGWGVWGVWGVWGAALTGCVARESPDRVGRN